ncbi:uncharacterized protein [Pituophis catenifer annectens]|uniref:uncharacterized protein n=1 Tax=Pituophis catenifer annectens TaxID=94852 RepID=UPI003992B3BF
MGFEATSADKCFFTKREDNTFEGVLVYVDDILYISKHKDRCDKFATELGSHFSLKSLGKIDKYLGVQVMKTDKGFRLSQREKIIELLSKCHMSEAKPSETPMQPEFLKTMYEESEPFTDNKLYISNWTRPDIALAVNLLSRHVSKPTITHWNAIKRLLRYLKFSADAQLCLEPEISEKPKLTCYADADWAGDIKSRKSTSGYVLLLNYCPIHWYTGKQKLVATSTTEAEFVCLSKAANNLVWFDDLLCSIWAEPSYPIAIRRQQSTNRDPKGRCCRTAI